MNRKDLLVETLKTGGMLDAYYKHVYLPELARDIILYGKSDAVGVLSSYDITAEDLSVISTLPLFKAEVANVKKRLAESDHASIHLKGVELLDATLHVMQSRIIRGELDTKELIAIGKFLADLTGAWVEKGKGDMIGPVNTGTIVNIKYGDDLDKIPQLARDAPVNATYTRIVGDFDVDKQIVEVEQ